MEVDSEEGPEEDAMNRAGSLRADSTNFLRGSSAVNNGSEQGSGSGIGNVSAPMDCIGEEDFSDVEEAGSEVREPLERTEEAFHEKSDFPANLGEPDALVCLGSSQLKGESEAKVGEAEEGSNLEEEGDSSSEDEEAPVPLFTPGDNFACGTEGIMSWSAEKKLDLVSQFFIAEQWARMGMLNKVRISNVFRNHILLISGTRNPDKPNEPPPQFVLDWEARKRKEKMLEERRRKREEARKAAELERKRMKEKEEERRRAEEWKAEKEKKKREEERRKAEETEKRMKQDLKDSRQTKKKSIRLESSIFREIGRAHV